MQGTSFLRCLGQPALFAPNGEVIRFRTKKHLALLVYLAVDHRRAHRRDRLAEFLWPNALVPEARHSLATALSVLRPRVGVDALETTRDHVSLLPGKIRLDLNRLIQGDVLGEETTSPLEVGGFLEGFEIPDAPEFALWKDRQQARLLPVIKDALIILIDRCRRMGESREIEQLADRMIVLDELSEEAVRAKMEARAFAGDRLTALKIFEEWKQKLNQELGASPSELVEGMAVRLRRRGWERTNLVDIPTVPTDQWKDRPFVGRSREYRVIYEAWEGMRQGVPAHALVLGDSGVGKSTLVERFSTAAGLEGAAVSRVQCYDIEKGIPYAAIVGLVQGLLERSGISATPPESLAELARTIPEIRRRFPTIPASIESVGATARIRLLEAFHDMLQAVAEEHPVILVVDDLHLADEASLAILHLVMRRSKSEKIMVIMIARPGEVAHTSQASRFREGSKRLGVREVEISSLSEEESQELLMALAGSRSIVPNDLVRRSLVRAAGGFPMVLELLFQDWEVNGDQSLALSVEAMTAELRGAGAPPQLYRGVLERLVRSMDPYTHGVLNVASILGHRLNEVGLYRIADFSVGQTMRGMAELVSRRVLRDSGDGLEFVNELVRTAVYLGVPSPLRRVLHSNIADQLLKVAEKSGENLGLEIAWHCMRAGRVSEATPHLLRGAREAIRSGAPHAAERALTSALSTLTGESFVDASLLLAEVLQEEGRFAESLELLSALPRAAASPVRDRILALTALARESLGQIRPTDVQELTEQLREVVRYCPDPGSRVLAARAMAYLLLETSDRRMTEQVLKWIDIIPSEDLDVDALGQLALARALLYYQVGDSLSSLSTASSAVSELKRRGAANLVAVQLQGGIGSIRSREGQYEAAIDCFQEAVRMGNRLGNDRQLVKIHANLALCFGRVGKYLEQFQSATRALEGCGPEFGGYIEIQAAYSQSFSHALRGRPDLALNVIETLQARMLGPITPWILQAWSLWKADLLHLSGERGRALDVARTSLLDHDLELRTPSFAGPYARWLAKTADTEKERHSALEKLKGLEAQLDRYDALDQAEILCAIALQSRSSASAQAEALQRLRRLPAAVSMHLVTFGLLPFH